MLIVMKIVHQRQVEQKVKCHVVAMVIAHNNKFVKQWSNLATTVIIVMNARATSARLTDVIQAVTLTIIISS